MRVRWAMRVALAAVVGLVGCGDVQDAQPQTMTVAGKGAAIEPHRGRAGERPKGLELKRVTVQHDRDSLRVQMVPRDPHSSWQGDPRPGTVPLWSFSVWIAGEEKQAEPTYWVATSADPAATPGVLAVWLCHRNDLRPVSGATPQCHQRLDEASGGLHEGTVEIAVPLAQLSGLLPEFWWTATAAGGAHAGASSWVHCVPQCTRGEWAFPPQEARARFSPSDAKSSGQ